MRILITSDIHANHPALYNLLRQIETDKHLQFDEVRCLGDVLGYYGHPVRAWKEIYALDPHLRAGNHDVLLALMASSKDYDYLKMGSRALLSVAWLNHLIKQEGLWLQIEQWYYTENPCAPLDITVRRKNDAACRLIFVHGTPHVDEKDDPTQHTLTLLRPQKNREYELRVTLKNLADKYPPPAGGRTIAFVGHTHVPMIVSLKQEKVHFYGADYIVPQQNAEPNDLVFRIEEQIPSDENIMIVNGGSVTFQRDGVETAKARAHAVLLDTETLALRFIKVHYNHSAVERNMPSDLLMLDASTRLKLEKQVRDGDTDGRYAGKSIDEIWRQHRGELIEWLLKSPINSEVRRLPELLNYEYTAEGFRPCRNNHA